MRKHFLRAEKFRMDALGYVMESLGNLVAKKWNMQKSGKYHEELCHSLKNFRCWTILQPNVQETCTFYNAKVNKYLPQSHFQITNLYSMTYKDAIAQFFPPVLKKVNFLECENRVVPAECLKKCRF